MQITNGVVEFERSVRPADFENKHPRVTLNYTIAEGEDPEAVIRLVGDMAHAEVYRLLHKSEIGAQNGVERRRPLQPEDIAKELTAAVNAPVQMPKIDPGSDTSKGEEVNQSGSLNAPPITDADLQKLCQWATTTTRDPSIALACIKDYVEQPGQRLISIAPEKRTAFEADLRARVAKHHG